MRNYLYNVEEANYLNNRSYVFRMNNNFPTHYNQGLRNHENLLYGNQSIVPYGNQLSTTTTRPGFQGKGDSSSNYQGQRRLSSFEENILYLLNDIKKICENIISNLENNQLNMDHSRIWKPIKLTWVHL